MAGQGPPPKFPEDRANRVQPERGDWLTLPPLKKPVLPALPRRARGEGEWSPRVRRLWDAWRKDWATGSYGPADIAMAVELAYIYEDVVRERNSKRLAEVRQWMDRLALTQKGKRDLRLRTAPIEVPFPNVMPGAGDFSKLRLVDEAG